MSFLIDTNVLSELVRKKPNQAVVQWFKAIPDDTLFISVLTIGELRKGVESVKDNKRKLKLKSWLEHDVNIWFDQRVLNITQPVAERWGRICAEARRPLPVIDSLLAAQALQHDLSIVTRNHGDFEFQGLDVVNPWL